MATTLPAKPPRVKSARTLRDRIFTPTELEVKRYKIAARSDFNRQMHRTLALIHKLLDRLETLSTFSEADVLEEWAAAGLPAVDEDDFVAGDGILATAREIPHEAICFLWAVRMFAGAIEANCLDVRRR